MPSWPPAFRPSSPWLTMSEAAGRLGKASPLAVELLLQRTGPHQATQVCGRGRACMVRADYLSALPHGRAEARGARGGHRRGGPQGGVQGHGKTRP